MNPSFSAPHAGTPNLSGGYSINNQTPRANHGRNKFNLSHGVLMTARFADITPFYVAETIGQDTTPLNSHHELRSFALKSPMLSTLRAKKTYIHVPNSAILPRTWDLIFTNPVKGDDVPDDANCVISSVDMARLFQGLIRLINMTPLYYGSRLFALFSLESIVSYGALTNMLGASFGSLITVDGLQFDKWMETRFYPAFQRSLRSNLRGADIVRDIADMFRDQIDNIDIYVSDPSQFTELFDSANFSFSPDLLDKFNIERLAAYQISCAHFFTNEFVDSIYTSQLYLQNMQSIGQSVYSYHGDNWPSFEYNGTQILYDVFSGRIIHDMINLLFDIDYHFLDEINDILSFYNLIFGIRKSLRHTDYFTGAKTRPLAVGDVTAPVVGEGVSAVDMSRNIQAQRFLNAVNRAGRKFSSYMASIMGSTVGPDRHEPRFISQSESSVSGFEVEQTAPTEGQPLGTQASLLKSNFGNYEFTVDSEMSSIIIGLLHFDVVRFYCDSISRFFWHADRFDMFNPYMQYIGDQSIYSNERIAGSTVPENPFGYGARYGEYKQSYSRAFGAFCTDALPSWAFTDSKDTNDRFTKEFHIDPENIRNRNFELDRFYASLPYFGLANYFHFIILVSNQTEPVRPIEYKPNIL